MADYTMFEPDLWSQHLNTLKAIDVHLKPSANKHDRVILLIEEAIKLGIRTDRSIVAALAKLGHNPKHVGKMLRDLCGNNPKRYRWRRDAEGFHHLFI